MLVANSATGVGVEDDGVTVTQDTLDSEAKPWYATVNNLPRFDENGRPYEYILLEAGGFPSYTTKRDPAGDYVTTVLNGGPGEAIPILVRKVWLDDGDDLHRDPVTFTVYSTKNNNQPIKQNGADLTVTLRDGLWHQVVMVPVEEGVTVDDLYVVETSVGSEDVKHYLEEGSFNKEALYGTEGKPGGVGADEQVFDVTTEHHRYQVTYAYQKNETTQGDAGGVQGTFTVTNRRLGNIDLTVEKTWVDGEKTGDTVVQEIAAELERIAEDNTTGKRKLALVFRLEFADETKTEDGNDGDGWEITYSGFDAKDDTVRVGGEKVFIYDENETQTSSEQVIIGVNKSGTAIINDEAHFFGLPKYDAEGKAVEYTVEELWLDVTEAHANGGEPKELTRQEMAGKYPQLWALWKDYSVIYGTPVITDNTTTHTQETQSLNVTNTRTGTKDVVWYKEWQDHFTSSSNLRPDIYLDIYRVIHVMTEDGIKERIEPVQANVKWEEKWEESSSNQNSISSWTVTLSGVQKYDSLGYEILYYAVERTVVAVGDYD